MYPFRVRASWYAVSNEHSLSTSDNGCSPESLTENVQVERETLLSPMIAKKF
jgi:hypothetical protein